jgi:hypothetical protein
MITDFVIDKMSGYVAGGMAPVSAALSTMGELFAIYRGRHYSRDTTGVMRPTPPPENIAPEKAGGKCRTAINEILKYCKENPPLSRKTPPVQKREGIAALEYMTGQGIPLIGVYDSKATINRKGEKDKAYTADIEVIKSLMAGQGDKEGRAKGTKIKRFSPLSEISVRNRMCIDNIDFKGSQNIPVYKLSDREKNAELFFKCAEIILGKSLGKSKAAIIANVLSGNWDVSHDRDLDWKKTAEIIRENNRPPVIAPGHGKALENVIDAL